jgi:hypothetical protein
MPSNESANEHAGKPRRPKEGKAGVTFSRPEPNWSTNPGRNGAHGYRRGSAFVCPVAQIRFAALSSDLAAALTKGDQVFQSGLRTKSGESARWSALRRRSHSCCRS